MTIEEVGVGGLLVYQQISCAFEVLSRVDLGALRSGELVEVPVKAFVKDYDVFLEERPENLPRHWDMQHWGVLLARQGEAVAGGAIVARSEPEVERAILQDVRVAPAFRGGAVGRALVEFAVQWARERSCREMLVETQDINVAACRLYFSCGFRAYEIDPHGYPPELGEVKVLWGRGL